MPLTPLPLRVGLVGRSIAHSLAPVMHREEARAQGLALRFDLFELPDEGLTDVEAIAQFLAWAAGEGVAGFNVTFPFKQAVMSALDRVSEDARAIGAVNLVLWQDGTWVGHNTDAPAFLQALRERLPQAPLDEVAVMGAGGAAAAVAHGIAGAGARGLRVHNRTADKAEALAAALCRRFGPGTARAVARPEAALDGAAGVAHTTSLGMHGHPGLPLDPALLSPAQWVADVVYRPLLTPLLAAAAERGCTVVDGGGMAAAQAAAAFRHFTGREADRARMQSVLRAHA